MAVETIKNPATSQVGRATTTHAEDFPEAVVDGVAEILHKPRARGWIHVYAAAVAIIAGATLVSVSWAAESTRANGGISRDGKTIVYHLRPDVRFSDGSRVTSFDVAETIGRIAFPGSDVPTRVAYDDVAAVMTKL